MPTTTNSEHTGTATFEHFGPGKTSLAVAYEAPQALSCELVTFAGTAIAHDESFLHGLSHLRHWAWPILLGTLGPRRPLLRPLSDASTSSQPSRGVAVDDSVSDAEKGPRRVDTEYWAGMPGIWDSSTGALFLANLSRCGVLQSCVAICVTLSMVEIARVCQTMDLGGSADMPCSLAAIMAMLEKLESTWETEELFATRLSTYLCAMCCCTALHMSWVKDARVSPPKTPKPWARRSWFPFRATSQPRSFTEPSWCRTVECAALMKWALVGGGPATLVSALSIGRGFRGPIASFSVALTALGSAAGAAEILLGMPSTVWQLWVDRLGASFCLMPQIIATATCVCPMADWAVAMGAIAALVGAQSHDDSFANWFTTCGRLGPARSYRTTTPWFAVARISCLTVAMASVRPLASWPWLTPSLGCLLGFRAGAVHGLATPHDAVEKVVERGLPNVKAFSACVLLQCPLVGALAGLIAWNSCLLSICFEKEKVAVAAMFDLLLFELLLASYNAGLHEGLSIDGASATQWRRLPEGDPLVWPAPNQRGGVTLHGVRLTPKRNTDEAQAHASCVIATPSWLRGVGRALEKRLRDSALWEAEADWSFLDAPWLSPVSRAPTEQERVASILLQGEEGKWHNNRVALHLTLNNLSNQHLLDPDCWPVCATLLLTVSVARVAHSIAVGLGPGRTGDSVSLNAAQILRRMVINTTVADYLLGQWWDEGPGVPLHLNPASYIVATGGATSSKTSAHTFCNAGTFVDGDTQAATLPPFSMYDQDHAVLPEQGGGFSHLRARFTELVRSPEPPRCIARLIEAADGP